MNVPRCLGRFGLVALCLGLVSAARTGAAEKPDDALGEHYTKYEYRIPMRDGVKLFTTVYLPKDASAGHSYPFLMTRTPYDVSPYGVDEFATRVSPDDAFEEAGYIFVLQDVRGRNLSEGTFVEATPAHDAPVDGVVDESTDTYDTVDWLLSHVPGHNGRVGIWGISYPGFYAAAGIINSHPAIKAASPQAPVADLYRGDDCYHNGAFMLAANFGFYAGYFYPQANPRKPADEADFDFGTKDGYEFFLGLGPIGNAEHYLRPGGNSYWTNVVEHTTYDDFWQARSLQNHLRGVHCAVLTVGGLFDAEDPMGPHRVYQAIEANNPGIFNALVLGPWVHGGWAHFDGRSLGSVDFAAATAKFYNQHILLPFFEQHLKDQADAKLPEAYVFETGTNVWRQYPAWPAPGATKRTLYLREAGGLSFDAPTAAAAATGADSADSYVSDPAKPVPFVGYTALQVPPEYMVADQRFAATRPDVLVYRTEPLEEDLTFAGPLAARLFVSTTGTDSDWVVKLIDVYPPDRSGPPKPPAKDGANDVPPPSVKLAGYQQLVRGEPLRGKFRHSLTTPEAFTPGQVEELRIEMPDINHTFRRGHRIMVQVQSSWFPLIDRNPQTFVDIPHARPEDFQKATETIHRSAIHASALEVMLLPQPVPEPLKPAAD